jgi:hypothetical protein
MPNFLIGVLAQREQVLGDGTGACLISTAFFDEIYFIALPIISVNACLISTAFFDEIYFTPLPIITVNACPISTTTMDIIYNI